ncbi:OmpA family protein [uncultured Roseovarius sp.]|uniref:OmpA family protein n=1 Tax=uncultured Roseovarius sp. TaxID=293344 RepID=UPI00262AE068|nr:OmpA family protein [uncultured Roseovarius sp.]
MRRVLALTCIALAVSSPARAVDLALPANATLTREVERASDSVSVPTGPYSSEGAPLLRLDGRLTTRAWRFPAQEATTLQILTPLRDQLVEAGWDVIFDCPDQECGGFDFRFALPVLSAPAMFVNLFDYRYLLARRGGAGQTEHVALIVSRSGRTGYIQITRATQSDAPPQLAFEAPAQVPDSSAGGLAQSLRSTGHVRLDGLDFDSGANTLGSGSHPSLEALAGFLQANPDARVALVGHTDSVGGFEPNATLSQARAEAVWVRLTEEYGVQPTQIEAHGIGYLSPLVPNTTAEGRDQNRRVEAVLLDTGEG